MAREFPTPQERYGIVHFRAWRSAVHVEREGLPEKLQRRLRVAGLEVGEREMPTQVAVERGIARVGGEPGSEEGSGRGRITLLVAKVRAGVRGPGVGRV